MAAEITSKVGIEPVLKKGSGGVFEVRVDGQLIHSKRATGRYPEHEDILRAIDALRR